MSDIKWVKLSVDMFEDRKIRQMQLLPNGDTALVIWMKLLVLAGRINDGGRIYITPRLGYTTKSLAVELQRPKAAVQRTMDYLVQVGMVEVDESGIITLVNWHKHQNVEGMDRVREQTRLRMKRLRERQSGQVCDVTVTSCDAPEEEREGEKEIHSLSHRQGAVEHESMHRSYLQGALGGGVVLLSEAQLEDLLERLSVEEFERYVGIVRDNELKGKHYRKKTHYDAILDMASHDRRMVRKERS